MNTKRSILLAVMAALIGLLALIVPQPAFAHCDTLDGPVVLDAKAALEKGDVTPVLKWVKKDNEKEIRKVFSHTLAVRKLNPEARELADHYFFETLVRVHRAGEGAPFTGLKPAGAELNPGVHAADGALDSGSVDAAVKLVNDEVAKGIRARFAKVKEAHKHMNDSVEAGREYVEAYVEYVHYVEGLFEKAVGQAAHHDQTAEPVSEHHHE